MRIFFAIGVCLFSLTAYASIKKKSDSLSLKNFQALELSAGDKLKLVRMALKLSDKKRIYFLKKMPWAVDSMTRLAFDQNSQMAVRWRSLISIGYLEPQNPFLEKAVQHKDWLVRNAGLLALANGSRDKALKWSRKLLDDPALVIRTEAVKVIRRLKAIEMESILWENLNHQKNFKKGEGLWIRKHIVEALGDFSRPGQEKQFIELLYDKDPRVHKAAIGALEKITGIRFNGEIPSRQRQAWLVWWDQRQTH